ncbi:MAG: hypothetical protein JXQ96_06085 [Cyclobacteriaceae bacterium]
MKGDNLDKTLKRHFAQSTHKLELDSGFSKSLMEKVYLGKLKADRQRKIINAFITATGLIAAWFILLNSLWQSGLFDSSLGWVVSQIQFINLQVSWLKYAVIIFILHAIAVRLAIGLPLVFKKIHL